MKRERIKKVMELVSLCMLVNETIEYNTSIDYLGNNNMISVRVFDEDRGFKTLFSNDLVECYEVHDEHFNQFIQEVTQGLKSFLEDTDYEISIKEKKPTNLKAD